MLLHFYIKQTRIAATWAGKSLTDRTQNQTGTSPNTGVKLRLAKVATQEENEIKFHKQSSKSILEFIESVLWELTGTHFKQKLAKL